MNITLSKSELLETLTENRRQHSEVYLLAEEAYKKEVVKALKKAVERAEAGEDINFYRISPSMSKPVNNTDDYDHAIAMVEMSCGESVELDADDFRHFILDDWGWKDEFTETVGFACAAGALSYDILADYSNYSR